MASTTTLPTASPHRDGTNRIRVWEKISSIFSLGFRRLTLGQVVSANRSPLVVAHVGTAANCTWGRRRASSKKIAMPLIAEGLTMVTKP